MPERTSEIPQQPTRQWKRTATVVLLLLAGGAVVNVAVAWWCAAFLAEQRDGWSSEPGASWNDELGAMWIVIRYERSGYLRINSGAGRYLKPDPWDEGWKDPEAVIASWSRVPSVADLVSSGTRWVESASGWPLVSMRMRVYETDRSRNFVGGPSVRVLPRDVVEEGVILNSSLLPSSQASIPLRPLWPGFIINTIFYALLLWLLFFAPFAARRMLRRRRGLCETCAYPIGVNPVCTECGAAVRTSVARSS